ncbi:hypothetical protein GGP41_007201 [Bipolaris sorokiniana]|uniref:Uncharacterized protein n=1 Tax=Cochliobolus sativus TaxID=45130 RepID=A0A8H6E043_COCSA|nr:hypothetical protein GGP41_007201 [Bipolaris sorokiniana]
MLQIPILLRGQAKSSKPKQGTKPNIPSPLSPHTHLSHNLLSHRSLSLGTSALRRPKCTKRPVPPNNPSYRQNYQNEHECVIIPA